MPDAFEPSPTVILPASPAGRRSWIGRVDPRTRILATAVFAVVLSTPLVDRFGVLGIALAAAVVGVPFAGLTLRDVLARLLPLNVLMMALMVLMPVAADGSPLFSLGPIDYSAEGLRMAARIALKANAILLVLVCLLGTLDATTLGHALSHLRMPDKLTHLLLFTVRYLDVLYHEYLRLAVAMKARGFRPRMNLHTYRTYGHLVGMLLVRSLDRSERITAAMKCRGFRGRFYLLDHFRFSWHDAWFTAGSVAVLTGLLWMERV